MSKGAVITGEVVEPKEVDRRDPEVEARRQAALRYVRTFGDPVLRARALDVDSFDQHLKSEANQMMRIMNDSIGVGLAATQLGIMHRLIVYRKLEEQEETALVNPTLEWVSEEKETADEGCLSLPGILVAIERSESIRVQAKDLEGENLEFEVSGLEARVIQHEIDHLNGVLLVDRTSDELRKVALHHLREGTEMPLPNSSKQTEDEPAPSN